MCYVFGTEFIELPRCFGAGRRIVSPCEHGNGILSRYVLGNVQLIRHRKARSWHSLLQRLFRIGQPRLGGRMTVAADARIGERYLRLYSVHFESGRGADAYRADEARELVEDAASLAQGAIIGGDMNTSAYLGDLRDGTAKDGATQALLAVGWVDAHAGLAPEARGTSPSGVAIDLIFGKGVAFTGAGVGSREQWEGLSDHYPVWARVRLG
jgi:endonuclease/exonuclease/phosphatase family metal-dependent hydrolase